jgi:hypothetical protein
VRVDRETHVRVVGDGRTTINPSATGVTTSRLRTPQVLVRPDSRSVFVAGLSQNDGSPGLTLFAAGLTKRGEPDGVFGKHVFPGVSETRGQSALERDGKVVIAGFDSRSPTTHNAVVRITAHGHLDSSWSGDGILPLAGISDTISLGITPYGRVEVGRTVGTGPYDAEVRALLGTLTPTCHGELATHFSSNKSDTMFGTVHADVLVGLGGNDTVKGLAGDDDVCGNGGDDLLIGGTGTDVLSGGLGRDTLRQ